MAVSWVSLCNEALDRLGSERISSLTQGTAKSNLCNNNYEEVRDRLLRSYDWRCAKYRVELSLDEDTPGFDYEYQYSLPTSPYCLRVLRAENDPEYSIEGRKLLTDESEMKILYVKRIVDPTYLDPLCRNAFVLMMASLMCLKITNSKSLKEQIDTEFKAIILNAEGTSAIESVIEDMDGSESDLWVNAGR